MFADFGGRTRRTAGSPHRFELWLMLLMAGVLLIPIWSSHRIPTQDGPSHLYNAVILSELIETDASFYDDYYRVNTSPRSLPNWFSHAALVGLMSLFDPLVAEKVLLTALILLFVASIRSLACSADPSQAWVTFLALPFFYSFAFQKGFYNFCFSIPLFCLALAFWIRHRSDLTARQSAVLGSLIILCYLTHVLSALALLACIGLLWLVSIRVRTLRQNAFHVAALVPGALLVLWFLASGDAEGADWPTANEMALRLRYFIFQRFILAFATRELELAALLVSLALVIAVGATLLLENLRGRSIALWKRDLDGLPIASFAFFLGFLIAPHAAAGGSRIFERLPFYLFLVLLPWISKRIPTVWKQAIVIACVIATSLQVAVINARYRESQTFVEAALAGSSVIPANSTILPLIFEPGLAREGERAFGLRHVDAYYCLSVPCVSWGNYEADRDYFPIRFREGLKRPEVSALEAKQIDLEIAKYRDSTDYILAWAMPPDWKRRGELTRDYGSIFAAGRLEIFRRRSSGAVDAQTP